MFCSRTNVLNKVGAARTLRAFVVRPKPSPRSGVPPALRFSSLKYFPWNLKRSSRLFQRSNQKNLRFQVKSSPE